MDRLYDSESRATMDAFHDSESRATIRESVTYFCAIRLFTLLRFEESYATCGH